jgi:putative oxidoreductase
MATHVASPHHFESSDTARPARGADMLRYAVPFGRFLFALIFLMAGLTHFNSETIAYAASQGVPLASVAVPLSGVLALAGGLSVALGYKTRIGALLLVLFLVPVTLMMHRFWGLSDPQAAMMQQGMFMKNLSMLGGAILLGYFGAGPLSIDQRSLRVEGMRT